MLNTQSYSLFRLRNGDHIVGYMRYVSPTVQYYSTDLLWWAGDAIAYEHKDSYSTVKDKNSQYRVQRHSYVFVNPDLITAFKYNGYIPFDIV